MRIFISYRRADTPHEAHRIRQQLQLQFGESSVFIDRQIPPGQEFDKYLATALQGCQAVVAVMGNDYFRTRRRKAGDATDGEPDYVRWEVETALEMGIPVFPILVVKGKMPREVDLPNSLKAFTKKQALYAIEPAFDSAIDELIKELRTIQLIARSDNKVDIATQSLATTPEPRSDAPQWLNFRNVSWIFGCALAAGVCIDYIQDHKELTVERSPYYLLVGSLYLSIALLAGFGPLLFYRLVSVLRARLYLPVGDFLSLLVTASAYASWTSGFIIMAMATRPSFEPVILGQPMSGWLLLVPITLIGLAIASLVALEVKARAEQHDTLLLRLLPSLHLANLLLQLGFGYVVVTAVVGDDHQFISNLLLFLSSCLLGSIVVGYWHLHWGRVFDKNGSASHFSLTVLAMLLWIVITISAFSSSLARVVL